MRASKLVVVSLLLCVLGGGVVAATRGGSTTARQWAVVYLREPTLIGSTIVQGPIIFTHDETKMARGEPCTTVQLFEPGLGPLRRPNDHRDQTARFNHSQGFAYRVAFSLSCHSKLPFLASLFQIRNDSLDQIDQLTASERDRL